MNLLRMMVLLFSVLWVLGCTSQSESQSALAPQTELAPEVEEAAKVEVPEATERVQEVEAEEEVVVEPTVEAIPQDPVHLGLGAETAVDLMPAPQSPDPHTRPRRRMNVDQLKASIVAATGFSWKKGNKDALEELAATLGRPDYLMRVNADLEPGPVFTKFLKDAAYSVCGDLKTHELEIPAADRILMVHVAPEDTIESHPEEVDENIRMLLLRFHGHFPEPGASELEPWRWLFKSVTHLSNEPADGWRAMCVALIAHPDFSSY